MPTNDREVFDKLTSDEETDVYIDFIAYAIFARHKREWIRHYEQSNNGKTPSQTDIDQWISNITDFQFSDMQEEAARLFDSAAREYLETEIESEKERAVSESILAEVKGFTSPLRHLGIALLMAILAPILLGGVIFLLGVFDSSFPLHITFPGKGP
jgi:hypothetical protein